MADALEDEESGTGPLHDKKWRGGLHTGDYVAFVLNPASQKNQINIGRVDSNSRRDETATLLIFRPVLEANATKWKPIYFTAIDDGGCETLAVKVRSAPIFGHR